MNPTPLSVCIITYNEEENLPRCLASVAFADEIVVVDSQSTDRTVDIARQAGCRVISQAFLGYVAKKPGSTPRFPSMGALPRRR